MWYLIARGVSLIAKSSSREEWAVERLTQRPSLNGRRTRAACYEVVRIKIAGPSLQGTALVEETARVVGVVQF